MAFFTIATSIFFIMNPFGDIATFITILAPFSVKEQRHIIVREMLIALAILVTFTLFGEQILHYMNISNTTILISGGVILFIIAIHMIFPIPKAKGAKKEVPFIVPLAIPIVAGPGLISTLMIYSHKSNSIFDVLLALFVCWVIAGLVYYSSSFLRKFIQERETAALEKLGGIILTMFSIQMLSDGIVEILAK